MNSLTESELKVLRAVCEKIKGDIGLEDEILVPPNTVLRLLDMVVARDQAIEVLKTALDYFRISHEHKPGAENYRELGDTYGYCLYCHGKVSINEDEARDALAHAAAILEGK